MKLKNTLLIITTSWCQIGIVFILLVFSNSMLKWIQCKMYFIYFLGEPYIVNCTQKLLNIFRISICVSVLFLLSIIQIKNCKSCSEQYSETTSTEFQSRFSGLELKWNEDFCFRAGGLYGGWSFGAHNGSSKTTLWFNNKGWHILPTYVNLLSNVALRLNSSNSNIKGRLKSVIYKPFISCVSRYVKFFSFFTVFQKLLYTVILSPLTMTGCHKPSCK